MKRRIYWMAGVPVLIAVFLAGCNLDGSQESGSSDPTGNPDPEETLFPHEVENLSASAGNQEITLSWSDPQVSDFDRAEVTWTPGGTEPGEVDEGSGGYVATGLTNGTEYSFTVRAVATDGTTSQGVTVSETPVALDVFVAVGDTGAAANTLYSGDGDGAFSAGDTTADANASSAVDVADVNGDGHLDVVVSNGTAASRVYFGDGTGAFTGADLASGYDFLGIALADFDDDGNADVFMTTTAEDRIYLGAGDGTFDDGSNVSTNTAAGTDVAVGDFDGDGNLDAFVPDNGKNVINLGNGDGSFTASGATDAEGRISYSAQAGYLNDDDDLDVYVANLTVNRVYIGDGSGGFTVSDTGPTPVANSRQSRGVVLGDLDGDGHLDAVVANDGTANRVYLGNGDGTFGDGSNLAGGAGKSTSVTLADFDSDGNLDAFITNNGSEDLIYLGDGTGGFDGGSNASASTGESMWAVVGEFDGR